MTKLALGFGVIVAVILSGLSGPLRLEAQRQTTKPPTPADVLDAAQQGKAQDAWALWEKLPTGTDKLRLGIDVAALTRQVGRGLDLYDAVTNRGLNPDRAALKALSLAAAADLAESPDLDTRAAACSAALVLDVTHAPCLRALKAMTEPGRSSDEQAFGIAALANARIAPYPERLGKLNLRSAVRVRFVQSLTRLPSAERLALVRPMLSDADAATQYQAVLFLSNIPGPEVTAVLKNVQPNGPLRQALAIARARHGDSVSLASVGPMLADLDPYLKIQAAQALAEAGDSRGVPALREMIANGIDVYRVSAADALSAFDLNAARRALTELLAGSSAAVRPAVIYAAGRAGLGIERGIYRELAAATPADRASAVSALADTLMPAVRPKPPSQP